jgi:hypothetical protein
LPVNTSLDDHLLFNRKPGGPPCYGPTTDKPVQYLAVADRDGEVLGYAWAGDEDAAAYEPREAGGPRAANEGGFWIRRLRDAKQRGILPSQALTELYGTPETVGKGRPLPGSLADAPNAAAGEAVAKRD